MRAARLLALERGIRDGLGHVEHVVQLERVHDFGVKRAVSIFNDDVLKTLSQSSQRVASLLHALFIAIDSCAFLHGFLHLLANGRDFFFAAVLLQELAIETPLFVGRERFDFCRSGWRSGGGIGRCRAARPIAKDQ